MRIKKKKKTKNEYEVGDESTLTKKTSSDDQLGKNLQKIVVHQSKGVVLVANYCSMYLFNTSCSAIETFSCLFFFFFYQHYFQISRVLTNVFTSVSLCI